MATATKARAATKKTATPRGAHIAAIEAVMPKGTAMTVVEIAEKAGLERVQAGNALNAAILSKRPGWARGKKRGYYRFGGGATRTSSPIKVKVSAKAAPAASNGDMRQIGTDMDGQPLYLVGGQVHRLMPIE